MVPLLTQKEYDFIAESNRIENEPGVDFCHLDAYMYMAEGVGERNKVTTAFILAIHRRLMHRKLRLGVGEYRKVQVWIGSTGKMFANPAAVPHLMDQWIKDFNKMEKTPWELHKEFENIHPFIDGNGRTGRLLWAYDLLRRGEEIHPMLDTFREPSLKSDTYCPNTFNEKRQRYYEALN